MQSRPSNTTDQNSSVEGACGKRQAMPTTAIGTCWPVSSTGWFAVGPFCPGRCRVKVFVSLSCSRVARAGSGGFHFRKDGVSVVRIGAEQDRFEFPPGHGPRVRYAGWEFGTHELSESCP